MTIALSMIILSVVIALGKILGKTRLFGVSLGVTWVLFVGIVFSHYGYRPSGEVLHFVKEFGLILFVYSIGMQVGPSFFSNFRAGGLKLNLLSVLMVVLAMLITKLITEISGTPIETMVGVMSGAVTNTPGLGAAQQAYADATGNPASGIALGYAVAYPLGVIGCILSFLLVKVLFYRKSLVLTEKPAPVKAEVAEPLAAPSKEGRLVTHKYIISKKSLNGVSLGKLAPEEHYGITITKIRRAGVEIAPGPHTLIQMGDTVTVTGPEASVAEVGKIFGNSRKKLDQPNLITIFAGIALGCLLGSIPFNIPGVPQPLKLGLAGGPLIVSILFSAFGPRFHMVTYTTTSANLMIREIGISLFLACVGLEAGEGFVDTIVNKGGYVWILYGAIITVVPLIIGGLVGRYIMKVDYTKLIGALSGCYTDPAALAFATDQDKESDAPAVGYATVYPLTMFLRVLAAQMMILLF